MSKVKNQIQFDAQRCKGCGLCVLFCPRGSVRMTEVLNRQGVPYAEMADPSVCNACGICVRMCPDGAATTEDSSQQPADKPGIQDKQ